MQRLEAEPLWERTAEAGAGWLRAPWPPRGSGDRYFWLIFRFVLPFTAQDSHRLVGWPLGVGGAQQDAMLGGEGKGPRLPRKALRGGR